MSMRSPRFLALPLMLLVLAPSSPAQTSGARKPQLSQQAGANHLARLKAIQEKLQKAASLTMSGKKQAAFGLITQAMRQLERIENRLYENTDWDEIPAKLPAPKRQR